MSSNCMKMMKLRQPAGRWQDALPCGNGSIGALVYGNIQDELIVLNHEQLYLKSPKPSLNEVYMHLGEYRKMILDGNYKQAQSFFEDKMKEAIPECFSIDPYQPAFDIELQMDTGKPFGKYHRLLDFESGEALVEWSNGDLTFQRRLFVSRADNAIVLHVCANKNNNVNFSINLAAHDHKKMHKMGAGGDTGFNKMPFDYSVEAFANILRFSARYSDGREYGGVGKVITKGAVTRINESSIIVENASEALVILKIFIDEPGKDAFKRLENEIDGMCGDYKSLLNRHIALHGEIFNRVCLDLHVEEDRSLGYEVTEESNAEIFTAIDIAVDRRLVVGIKAQTGWSLVHMANTYARLGKGDKALECL